jgi:hypothetical protein
MAFDHKRFLADKFEPRSLDISVPWLKNYFSEDEKPIWTVKSLNGAEIGRADELTSTNKLATAMLEALLSSNAPETAKRVKELLGRSDEKPREVAKRIYHLHFASVKPKCPLELAVKICDSNGVLFYELTNNILVVSGQGYEPGKSKPSGKIKK